MASRIDYRRLADVLVQWQELQRCIVYAPPELFSWDPANRLIESAGKLDEFAKQHFNEALERSDSQLTPLSDPLRLNLGEHRWLSKEREQSYSDWLVWILQGMSVTEILLLFGVVVSGDPGKLESIRREEIDQPGRTDIIVRFGDERLLLIQVKTEPAGGQELRRYEEWASRPLGPKERNLFALIALEEPETDLSRFQFVSWHLLCKRLRRYAGAARESDMLKAAMILAFCGAVEQNLLGISVPPARFRAMASIDYLSTWMDLE